MSISLQIDREKKAAPAAVCEPLEKQSWAFCTISVAGRCVTENLNHRQPQKSDSIEMPLFPVAEWLVNYWWALLYEPCRGEAPPKENSTWKLDTKLWLSRHCIRSSDSAFVLPYMHLFSAGRGLQLVWYEDGDSVSDTQYITSGNVFLERTDTEEVLSALVDEVLDWCSSVHDERVDNLMQDWEAIKSAEPEERQFCESAGRMGLDPHYVTEWPDGILDFVAKTIGARSREPLVEDLLEATEPECAPALWNWLNDSQHKLNLSSRDPLLTNPLFFPRAKDHGYRLAKQIRAMSGISEESPIGELGNLMQREQNLSLTLKDYNHIPSRNVSAIVGWNDHNTACIAGPVPHRSDNRRFLEARGVYHALTGCMSGPRLLTRAYTWDQKAGRAFAAELLAPKDALAEEARSDMDIDERKDLQDKLAIKYDVSTELVRLQLQNHGVWGETGA